LVNHNLVGSILHIAFPPPFSLLFDKTEKPISSSINFNINKTNPLHPINRSPTQPPTKMPTPTLKPLLATTLSTFLLYCSFSRFTHGVYTPQMHAYQTDRFPDDNSTTARIILLVDLLFAILVAIPRTRNVGAAAATCVMAIGVIMRRFEGKDPVVDSVLTLGVFACWMGLGAVEW
jgi:hypothetical protein